MKGTSSNSIQYSFQQDEFDRVPACSVFTNTLVKGIRTGNADLDRGGIISCDELYRYLSLNMTSIIRSQIPQIMLSGESSYNIDIVRNPIVH